MANSTRVVLVAVAAFALSGQLGAQGCRDTVSQTNPAQQQSYREAIGIMLGGALAVAGAGALVVRRFGR